MDKVVITIKGKRHNLWRAVDQDGLMLEVSVQKRRDTKAAKRFMRKLLTSQGASPRNKITSSDHRFLRQSAMQTWREIACLKGA